MSPIAKASGPTKNRGTLQHLTRPQAFVLAAQCIQFDDRVQAPYLGTSRTNCRILMSSYSLTVSLYGFSVLKVFSFVQQSFDYHRSEECEILAPLPECEIVPIVRIRPQHTPPNILTLISPIATPSGPTKNRGTLQHLTRPQAFVLAAQCIQFDDRVQAPYLGTSRTNCRILMSSYSLTVSLYGFSVLKVFSFVQQSFDYHRSEECEILAPLPECEIVPIVRIRPQHTPPNILTLISCGEFSMAPIQYLHGNPLNSVKGMPKILHTMGGVNFGMELLACY